MALIHERNEQLTAAEQRIAELKAAMKYTGTELGKAREEIERLRAALDAANEQLNILTKDCQVFRSPEALAAVEVDDE